jgi:triosephosphate isomerase
MKPLIVANWKCNPTTLKEAKQLFNSVVRGIKGITKVETVICPPFVYLPILISQDPSSAISFGGQSCFWEEKGAFTGEISPAMLKNLGCEYVIIGHSERRRYLNETDEMINKKIKAALSVNLKVILCVGETLEEKNSGETEKVIESQIKNGLEKIIGEGTLSIPILAYEPIWAIGTGKACGVSEAGSVNSFIRKIIKDAFVLYGGSVNSQNARDYVKIAGFQGLLVGGASLDPEEFVKLVKNIDLIS